MNEKDENNQNFVSGLDIMKQDELGTSQTRGDGSFQHGCTPELLGL